jgi:hypothetical protein
MEKVSVSEREAARLAPFVKQEELISGALAEGWLRSS